MKLEQAGTPVTRAERRSHSSDKPRPPGERMMDHHPLPTPRMTSPEMRGPWTNPCRSWNWSGRDHLSYWGLMMSRSCSSAASSLNNPSNIR